MLQMVSFASLWLPLVLATVLVFIASSIIHMGPFWHRRDFPQLPREAEVLSALRPLALPPGDYMLPRAADMATYKSPEFSAKLAAGPVAVMTVLPNRPVNMGRNLATWFVYLLVVNAAVALIAARTLPFGTLYPHVFKVTGAVAFLGFALALCQQSIWYGRSWGLTFKSFLDGAIYAGLTAGTFGWLWPR
jgi:hypothetical protein